MKKIFRDPRIFVVQILFPLCLCVSVVGWMSGCAELKSIPVQLYRAPFEIQKSGLASARVLDSEGREIQTLWKNRAVASGPLTVVWDGRNEKGETLLEGRYVIQLSLKRWNLRLLGKFR